MNTFVDPSTQDVQFPIRFTDRSRTTDAYTVESDEEDLLPDDLAQPTRQPTSARRYSPSPYQQTRQQTQALVPPKRATAHERVPAKPPKVRRPRGRIWITLLVGMLAMGALVVAVNAAIGWVQAKQLDWTYGYPRTFQVDAVVGHGHDSRAHPSHFLALMWDFRPSLLETSKESSRKPHIMQVKWH